MSKNYFIPLMLAIAFLFVANTRADFVPMDGKEGNAAFTFGISNIVGNEYNFASTTYTLTDPNSVFASFELNTTTLETAFRAIVNNFPPAFPGVDLSGEYNGAFTWNGKFTVNGQTYSLGGPYTESVTGITYNPPGLTGGTFQYAESQLFYADFSTVSLMLTEADFGEVNSLTIAFHMSDFVFDAIWTQPANIMKGWQGSVDGTFGISWTSREVDAAIPEPATLAVMGLGLAGLGIARRRMKK